MPTVQFKLNRIILDDIDQVIIYEYLTDPLEYNDIAGVKYPAGFQMLYNYSESHHVESGKVTIK